MSSYTFDREKAVNIYVSRLIRATESASAQGADHAEELAPLGKGTRSATGSSPRYFSVKLQTTRNFDKVHKSGRASGIRTPEVTRQRARLLELRSLNRGELTKEVRQEDVKFFRFSSGSRKGQTPDALDVRPARGPGGEVVKGAITHYTPGTLKKGIHPIDWTVTGLAVHGGFASEAPYSVFVEKGFHHKGGTEVAPNPFMEPAAEGLRDSWNSGQFFEE